MGGSVGGVLWVGLGFVCRVLVVVGGWVKIEVGGGGVVCVLRGCALAEVATDTRTVTRALIETALRRALAQDLRTPHLARNVVGCGSGGMSAKCHWRYHLGATRERFFTSG